MYYINPFFPPTLCRDLTHNRLHQEVKITLSSVSLVERVSNFKEARPLKDKKDI